MPMKTSNGKNKDESQPTSSPVVHGHQLEHNWDKPFWRSVSSSEYGTGSTSRISTLAIVAATLTVLLYLVWKNDDIPHDLINLGLFAALLITAVYSPAKLAAIFKSYFSKK